MDSKLCKDKVHVTVHHCHPSVTAQCLACSICAVFADQMVEQMEKDWESGTANKGEKRAEGRTSLYALSSLEVFKAKLRW